MKAEPTAHYMGRTRWDGDHPFFCLFLAFLMLFSTATTLASARGENDTLLPTSPAVHLSSRTSGGDVDAPAWMVGDSWVYDGFFDVAALVAGSGTGSNVQTLTGDLDMWINDITTKTTENRTTLAYHIRSSGTFRANNVNLQGYTGDLKVDYTGNDYVRASDLSAISNSMHLVVEFSTFGGLITIDVADITVLSEYSPPREDYDFPIRVGESWNSSFTTTTTWSGSSDYFTLPSDSTSSTSFSHSVVAAGNPGVPYSGCANSYNVTTYDGNGNVTSFRWWCPNANNDAWRHYQDDLGLIIDFKLKSYSPQTRSQNIDVELEYPAWVLDAPLGAWVNITNSGGSPVSGQTLEWRYEASGVSSSLTTAANGSAFILFDSGNATDPSPTDHDYASHGIIAWISSTKRLDVDTLTLDDNLISLDYRPRGEGVSVERTRVGDSLVLDPSIGYNAIPGDTLKFSVPVENKGILGGPATELMVIAPDGTSSRTPVPPLGALAVSWVDVLWDVPANQPVGTVVISFEVDPDDLMSEDMNQSNDMDTFEMFIGRLPIADLVQPTPTRTMTGVHLDARGSSDPDGGATECVFVIEVTSAVNQTFEEDDCMLENSWTDDGIYHVWLTVIDDENDLGFAEIDVEIINRAPWVNVTTPHHSIPVESSITFDASDNGDLDTLNPSAPVDILWNPPSRSDGVVYECEEGMVGQTCTVTPMEEGVFTMEVVVEDDDGAFTTGANNLIVTNIAPSEAGMTMWDGEMELTDERIPPIWQVDEDQFVTLKGDVHDSLNDLPTLVWGWQPDVDIDPNWYVETSGAESEIDVAWTTRGTHVIALEVLDDDGYSSGVVNGWVEVHNVAPTVEPILTPMPTGEDRPVTLTGVYSDTPSDLDSLRVCWDVDFEVDLDDNGDTTDDCDHVGAQLVHEWPKSGEKVVRFHVTDDDGEQAESLVNISVINLRPKAALEAESSEVMVGEELVIWTNDTSDSSSDMGILRFTWDFDANTDSDDDGDAGNDIDEITATGEPLRHIFTTSGVRHIRMTVTDESASSSIDLTVTVTESDAGLLGWIEEASGGFSPVVIGLGLILLFLLCVLAVSSRANKSGRNQEEWLLGIPPYDETSPTSAPPTYAFAETTAHTGGDTQFAPPRETDSHGTDYTSRSEPPPLTDEAVAGHHSTPDSLLPPPVPAAGLPQGWTMEQWNHYGAQWLHEQGGVDEAGSDNSPTPLAALLPSEGLTEMDALSPLEDSDSILRL